MNKNLKNKEKNMSPDELKKNNNIKLIIGLSFMFVMILFARTTNNPPSNLESNEVENNNSEVDQVISLLEDLKLDNYEMNINLIIDNDIVNIVRRMQNKEKEIFYIKYREEENAYLKDHENFYIINETSVKKTIEYEKLFDYDETFLLGSNIVNLLEKNSLNYIDLKEEKYNIRRYKIPLNQVLEFYNELYGVSEFTSLAKEISVDIRYTSNLESIYLDMTNFNNYIKESEYGRVTYEISFTDIGSVNLENTLELVNE